MMKIGEVTLIALLSLLLGGIEDFEGKRIWAGLFLFIGGIFTLALVGYPERKEENSAEDKKNKSSSKEDKQSQKEKNDD